MNKTILFGLIIFAFAGAINTVPILIIGLDSDGSGISGGHKILFIVLNLISLIFPLIIFLIKYRNISDAAGEISIPGLTSLVSAIGLVIGFVLLVGQLPLLISFYELKYLSYSSISQVVQMVLLIMLSLNLHKIVKLIDQKNSPTR